MCKRKDEGGRCSSYYKTRYEKALSNYTNATDDVKKSELKESLNRVAKDYLEKGAPKVPALLTSNMDSKVWQKYLARLKQYINVVGLESLDSNQKYEIAKDLGNAIQENVLNLIVEPNIDKYKDFDFSTSTYAEKHLITLRHIDKIKDVFNKAGIETGLDCELIKKGNKDQQKMVESILNALPKNLVNDKLILSIGSNNRRASQSSSNSMTYSNLKPVEQPIQAKDYLLEKDLDVYKQLEKQGKLEIVGIPKASKVADYYNIQYRHFVTKTAKKKPSDSALIKWEEIRNEYYPRKDGYKLYKATKYTGNVTEVQKVSTLKIPSKEEYYNYKTVAHEIMHSIDEFNQDFGKAGTNIRDTIAFKANRDNKAVNKAGYSRNEVFFREGFEQTYFGKIYPKDYMSEINSVTVERLFDPFAKIDKSDKELTNAAIGNLFLFGLRER